MKISVVIPIINEANIIGHAIARAWAAGADEVIVVDGGSTDGSLDIVKRANCQLVHSEPGRGGQQNAGAKASSGDVVLFLHADTWLDEDACQQIRTSGDGVSNVCGAFRQKIENEKRIYRWIESGNALRIRWRRLFYGDQGIFVCRKLFQSVGGFPEEPFMEDFILARKLRKHRPLLLDGPIHVDARRWNTNGPLRQTFRNWCIVTLYYLGIQPKTLVRLYHRHDQPRNLA